MKYKTTQKAVKDGYQGVISVGYCNAYNLLKYKTPVAYTTRREGWGADVYEIGSGYAIATGYASFGNIKPSYDLIKKYDDQAREIIEDVTISHEAKRIEIDLLLHQMIKAVKK